MKALGLNNQGARAGTDKYRPDVGQFYNSSGADFKDSSPTAFLCGGMGLAQFFVSDGSPLLDSTSALFFATFNRRT